MDTLCKTSSSSRPTTTAGESKPDRHHRLGNQKWRRRRWPFLGPARLEDRDDGCGGRRPTRDGHCCRTHYQKGVPFSQFVFILYLSSSFLYFLISLFLLYKRMYISNIYIFVTLLKNYLFLAMFFFSLLLPTYLFIYQSIFSHSVDTYNTEAPEYAGQEAELQGRQEHHQVHLYER